MIGTCTAGWNERGIWTFYWDARITRGPQASYIAKHLVKCVLTWLAVSLDPRRKPIGRPPSPLLRGVFDSYRLTPHRARLATQLRQAQPLRNHLPSVRADEGEPQPYQYLSSPLQQSQRAPGLHERSNREIEANGSRSHLRRL